MKIEPHILVVEDEIVWQGIYRDLLRALGYTVSLTGNLKDAIYQLEHHEFDAFLIDVRLMDSDERNKDGLTILKWLSERCAAERAIIKSGYMTAELRDEINSLGPCAVLGKTDEDPLGMLVESLEKAIARSHRLGQP